MTDPRRDPPGIDVQAVEAWLADHVAELDPPLRWDRFEGGHSNLTYQLQDSHGREAVLRRPPEGELLPKAHDVLREYRIMAALQETAVPVPATLAACDDLDVTGAPFVLMGRAPGRALMDRGTAQTWLPEERRSVTSEAFVDVLVALHALDPDEVGLGGLGRREEYVRRQLKAWYGSWNSSTGAADYDDPRLHDLHDLLREQIPEQGPARILHGDYGLHNLLVTQAGGIGAVLDWEIAALGDPLADLGYALNGWAEPGDDQTLRTAPPTVLEGFATREELAARYAAATGADLRDLDFYRAFNYVKTACIVHGVYARYRQGQKSAEGIDLDELRGRIGTAIDQAESLVAQRR